MKEKEKMGDRGKNPFDGSRRRLSSTAHKTEKDYNRKQNKKIIYDDMELLYGVGPNYYEGMAEKVVETFTTPIDEEE